MTRYEFPCSNCNRPINVSLPTETERAGYDKCEDKETTYHNLERIVQCQNCEHSITIYYCTDGHPLVPMGD
jgi:hypothetical protein